MRCSARSRWGSTASRARRKTSTCSWSRALRSVFADASIEDISASDLLGDYPAIQYVPPEGAFHLDLLTRVGEAYRWQDLEIVRAPFEGLTVSVVSPRTLYRMKRGTIRLKDRADAEMLKRRFEIEED